MRLRLKYKKVILFTLISTMGAGIVTLSIAPIHHNTQESMKTSGHNPLQEKSADSTDDRSDLSEALSPTFTVTVAPTPVPTLTPLPVYDLQEKDYPTINELIKQYYEYKLTCDPDKLKTLLSDSLGVPTEEQMKKDVRFIEEYDKIKCYVKKGYQENTYIVFVYHEVKLVNIKTPVPTVDQFYVITDKDGNYKIFSGDFDEVTGTYYHDRLKDKDVKALIADTNKKLKKAKKKDKDLKNYLNSLMK